MKKHFFIVIIITLMLMCSCTAGNGITDEEVEAMIPNFLRVYAYFDWATPETSSQYGRIDVWAGWSENSREIGNEIGEYYRVVDEKVDTWEEFVSDIKSVYTDEAADAILEKQDRFINYFGQTWCGYFMYNPELSDEFSFEIIENGSETATVVCSIESDLIGLEGDYPETPFIMQWTLSMKLTDNGWRIDNAVKDVIYQ